MTCCFRIAECQAAHRLKKIGNLNTKNMVKKNRKKHEKIGHFTTSLHSISAYAPDRDSINKETISFKYNSCISQLIYLIQLFNALLKVCKNSAQLKFSSN